MVLLYPEIKFTEYSFCHTPEGHAYTDLNSCLCLKQRGLIDTVSMEPNGTKQTGS